MITDKPTEALVNKRLAGLCHVMVSSQYTCAVSQIGLLNRRDVAALDAKEKLKDNNTFLLCADVKMNRYWRLYEDNFEYWPDLL